MDALPAGVMLAPLQTTYTTVLSLITRLIGQVTNNTLSPIRKVFSTMASLPLWNKVDMNVMHSLPSEYDCDRQDDCTYTFFDI